MVEVEVQDCLKSLQQYKDRLERELTGRTISLLTKWANRVYDITPKGDVDKFRYLYEMRQNATGWKIEPGLLMGNWQMFIQGEQVPGFIQRYDISGSSLQTDRQSMQFKLGDTIVLSNSTPYVGKIEEGYSKTQAPNGLQKPLLNAILDLYKIPFGDLTKKAI